MTDMISNEDVLKLAELSRLSLSKSEIERFKGEISSILEYVDSINEVELKEVESEVDTLNVLREDSITNEPDEYTEALLSMAPEREGRFLKVQKILSQDE